MTPTICCWKTLSLGSVLWATALLGQAKPDSAKAVEDAAKGSADVATKLYAVPSSAAFAYLGASPSKVERPTTVHDFGAQLVNGVGTDGRVKQGFALEFSPYTWGEALSLRDYQDNFALRALYNTQLSLATVKAAGDTSSTDFAIGVRVPLIDDSDPMSSRSVTSGIAAALSRCAPSSPVPDSTERVRSAKCLTKALTDTLPVLMKARVPSRWNARRLVLAGAAGLRFDQSRLNASTGTGARAWLNYSDGYSSSVQWIASVMYRYDRAQTTDSTFHAGAGGLRMNVGSDRLNAFAEGTAEWRFNQPHTVSAFTRSWSFGIEFRAIEGTWISTGVGTLYDEAKKADRTALLLGMQWGVASDKRFAPAK